MSTSVTAPRGRRAALLNTETALSLADGEETRRLLLHYGQAVFTVAPDPARPFEVEAAGGRIRALGTVFEVYEGRVAITVQEHAVQVQVGPESGAGARAMERCTVLSFQRQFI